jgi:dihydrolipoamide dehydrogenase
MSENAFDLVIIGGGPGGYVAAIRAAQLGMSVACVEKRGTLGGTCLNVGCIPSKALLHSSEIYEHTAHGLDDHGIKVSEVKLDLKGMMGRKETVVGDLTKGIEFLFKKNKVTYIIGEGKITAPGAVEVKVGRKKQSLTAGKILIATGSEVTPLPGVKIDEDRIVSSTGALALKKVPKKMVVIGGGVIGLELGSVWRRLGAEVEVIEFLDRLVPGMDGDLAKTLQRTLKKQGMTFRLSHKVTAAKAGKSNVSLTVEPAKGGDAETIKADVVLVAIGRRPFSKGVGLEDVGVELDERGCIKVDHAFQSNVPGIYAIGDVIAGPMLAHKAEEDGVAAVETMAGQAGHVDYNLVPGIVYTAPEVASIGKTEEQLKEDGVAYVKGKFNFSANSRARANGESEGFVKILADATTDRVLGVHMIGADAGEMIHEAAAVMAFGGSAEDIARTCHGHPTLSEAIKEAAMDAGSGAIHA